MRIALAQINPVVGDIDGNRARILDRLAEARDAGADLVLFPELATTGYPPEDLLLREAFLRAADESLAAIAAETHGIAALVGTPHLDGGELFNACAVCADGEIKAIYHKHHLPNYGVFDEERYFEEGSELVLLSLGGTVIGPTICEDIWLEGPPITDLARAGARVITNLSASPFHLGQGHAARGDARQARPRQRLLGRARERGRRPGRADLRRAQRRDRSRGNRRRPGAVVRGGAARRRHRRARNGRRRDRPRPRRAQDEPVTPMLAEPLDELEQMRLALELGLRDYVEKNGFREVVIGMSGGIDSALTAALAAEALGPERVIAVSMPSRYSSEETQSDARRVAESLGVRFMELPIEDAVESVDAALAEPFAGTEPDLAEENVQARIRGLLLMALSNKFGWLVVATGNKSELAVGYATLYGDMAGGFALLKDVFKTDVFRLARHLNERAGREVIPQTIIDRAPSAELRADQRDEDSLPPYAELDKVLEAYVELDRSREELRSDGFDPEVVDRALALIDRAEYKRRQAPPGVKLRTKAFGRDRRTPITNRWKG